MLANILKNWRLNLLALFFFILFCRLGVWQLQRAHEKIALLKTYESRHHTTPLNIDHLNLKENWLFYPVTLLGYYDNAHPILLDNKTEQGLAGYEVYVPFITQSSHHVVLIDRGFMNIAADRKVLPSIEPILGTQSITGLLINPPVYFALGKMIEGPIAFPLRVEFIELRELSKVLHQSIFPYLVIPSKNLNADIEQNIISLNPVSPLRHRAYAVQWFAFALTLLILFISLNR